jgi:hypothetical protein
LACQDFGRVPFNLYTGSAYVRGVIKTTETSYLRHTSDEHLLHLFHELQVLITTRREPVDQQMKKLHLTSPEEAQPLLMTPAVGMPKETPPLDKPGIPQLPHAKCHLDKHCGSTHGSTPLTWGQIKYLVDMARVVARGQCQEGTLSVLLLAMIAIISQQVSPAGA